MPKLSREKMFSRMLARLVSDRKKYLGTIEKLLVKVSAIDKMFADFDIHLDAGPAKAKRGPKPGRRGPGGRRKRRTFEVTGEESILAFVKKTGSPTTAQLNAHWDSEDRGGKADNCLTKMVQAGTLKRMKTKGIRGSRYELP